MENLFLRATTTERNINKKKPRKLLVFFPKLAVNTQSRTAFFKPLQSVHLLEISDKIDDLYVDPFLGNSESTFFLPYFLSSFVCRNFPIHNCKHAGENQVFTRFL